MTAEEYLEKIKGLIQNLDDIDLESLVVDLADIYEEYKYSVYPTAPPVKESK